MHLHISSLFPSPPLSLLLAFLPPFPSLPSVPPSLRPFPSRSQVSSAPPSSWRTAVCLVGGARDFELSSPSIMRRLIPSLSPRVTVFLHSPLDENSRKLWALKWAAALAANLTGQLAGGNESRRGSSSSSSISTPFTKMARQICCSEQP